MSTETQTATHAPAAEPAAATHPVVEEQQQPAVDSHAANTPAVEAFPGDNILPGAEAVYDSRKTIAAAPEDVWPWLVQWGKGRGGFYVPSKIEKVLPEKYRSAPTINPEWQALKVGDTVPDYGLGKKGKKGDADEEYNLEVVVVESQRALVYKGQRRGVDFTWALLLETPGGAAAGQTTGEADSTASATETVLHLRFRGQSQQTGWKGKVALQVGKVADGILASAIFPGITDRVVQQEKKAKIATA